jgi:hypothetical protein
MADTFYREPTNHGDNNNYHDYVMLQLRCGGRGGLTMELYDSGGALYLSAGYAGIDDGVTKGTVERTAAGAISLAGSTNNRWILIEVSVSGSAVTYSLSEEMGTEDTIPPTVVAAYDYRKAGFYVSATKRLIGIAFKMYGGTLGRIYNPNSNKSGFLEAPTVYGPIDSDREIVSEDYLEGKEGVKSGNQDPPGTYEHLCWKMVDLGTWDMDAAASKAVVIFTVGNWMAHIRGIVVFIKSAGGQLYDFNMKGTGEVYGSQTGIEIDVPGTSVKLYRNTGGFFDNPTFNNCTGYILVFFKDQ